MTRTIHILTAALILLVVVGLTRPGDPGDYPRDYFRSPLGIPLYLSGSFAEMRSGHFHSGLDIKTRAKTGYRVYAAAEGHVSRIKVSPYGFGKALYIRHPNGYTTVYAHLREYSDQLEEYVKQRQYEQRSYSIDAYPKPGQFPVTKGEVVALSGQSGGVSGPHLHFEIRDSATEWPLNPMLFNIGVEDRIAPQIRRVKVYTRDASSLARVRYANGKTTLVTKASPAVLTVVPRNGTYVLDGVTRIDASGEIGFGIEIRDTHNGSRSRLGAWEIRLQANDVTLYNFVAERFSFGVTRFINSHVDYEERVRNKRWIQRSHLLPGNRLPFYPEVTNRGFLDAGVETHKMTYTIADLHGNTSRLRFEVRGTEMEPAKAPAAQGEHVDWDRPFVLTRPAVEARFDEATFYDDFEITYRESEGSHDTFSPRYHIHDPHTPVHKRYTLSIRADELPARYRKRAMILVEDDEGDRSFVGGEYENGRVKARVREFGTFVISADTVRPEVKAINLPASGEASSLSRMSFKIEDEQSGIASYEGFVDGKWILFEYDAKSDRIHHVFDGRVEAGEHALQLIVTDGVGNATVFETDFVR